jgi:2-polyprenyl-6-hydroxyphenyl methylase/3-demethylubiquinone-9 3-methyltransferase
MAQSFNQPGPDAASVDPEEIARFEKLAETWWDSDGPMRPLHRFNPERIRFIRDRATAEFGRDVKARRPFAGLSLVDIGCGGGLITEPMARLGFAVTGIDAAAKNIAVAERHAAAGGLAIDYRCTTAEALAAEDGRFDIVLALEIVEHVADVDGFLAACLALAKPDGLVIVATLNRTARAYAFAIVGAEYVLGWLPRGTHDWRKFLRPSELAASLRRGGGRLVELAGMTYNPLSGSWRASRDLGVNYIAVAKRAS